MGTTLRSVSKKNPIEFQSRSIQPYQLQIIETKPDSDEDIPISP